MTFPIVAIGASAGGLEALEEFFRGVPPACGAAFVVVQHLDPTHPGMLVELLQRGTSLSVVQITDGMRLAPDHVYVIPPGSSLSLLHGVLHLMAPTEVRGLRLPIDQFFRSMAEDRGEHSLAVVLSGMGSDGTLGLRAIKAQAGAAFVQAPDDAKFDSMPRSAIDQGLADIVAPARELYARIVEYVTHAPAVRGAAPTTLSDAEHLALDKIVILLRTQTGHDFSEYKLSTLTRRIQRRMGLHHLTAMADYARYMRENPAEAELLYRELLVGVTRFFRDPEVWEQLRADVLPELLAAKTVAQPFRAWVTACSTGEEAYTLAILCIEAAGALGTTGAPPIQIFATDLDPDAITKARTGLFPLNIAADVPPPLLERYFTQSERGFRVTQEVRDLIVFATQNVVMDPPFTRLDLITCRNLLIYLMPALQRKVIPLFHYSLVPRGVLLLGTAETIGTATSLFTAISDKSRLYRRIDAPAGLPSLPMPSVFGRLPGTSMSTPATDPSTPVESLQAAIDRLLLARHAPAAVLVGDQGDILYVSGRTGHYLEPAAGKANWNVFAMARPGLDQALGEAFWRALRSTESVTLPHLVIRDGGDAVHVRVTIDPIPPQDGRPQTALIVFHELPAPPPKRRRRTSAADGSGDVPQAELERDLEQARLSLRSAREEMQLSQQELRSANEELQSTNEELQSTNEELTTSKEELQSMNEELQTVNQELQSKLDELSLASTDMANLLDSTSIATLFLDRSLNVRRFTTSMESIIRLLPGDVGRPITDIVSTLDFPELADTARQVMQSLTAAEREAAASDGRWFAVRMLPYRSYDDRVDGVVVTFTDITTAKSLEAALRQAQASLEARLAGSAPDGVAAAEKTS